MVARAHGNALAIQRLTDITGAEPLEHEQQDAGRGADEAQEGHTRRPLHLAIAILALKSFAFGQGCLSTLTSLSRFDV